MSGPARETRLPIEPLQNLIAARGHGVSAVDVAMRCGVNPQSIYRWRKEGLPLWSADRVAIHLGYHPAELWPEFHDVLECAS